MSDGNFCPFCGEGDFDLTGLKMHFENGWCEAYTRTPVSHFHVAKYAEGKLVDECAECGLDLRDSIHRRELVDRCDMERRHAPAESTGGSHE